jgi:hypothetical protein
MAASRNSALSGILVDCPQERKQPVVTPLPLFFSFFVEFLLSAFSHEIRRTE